MENWMLTPDETYCQDCNRHWKNCNCEEMEKLYEEHIKALEAEKYYIEHAIDGLHMEAD